MSKDYFFPNDTPLVGERWDFNTSRPPGQKYHSSATVEERPPYKMTVVTQKYDRKGNLRAEKVDVVRFSQKSSVDRALRQLGFSKPGTYSYPGQPGMDNDFDTGNVRLSQKGAVRLGRFNRYKPMGRFRRAKKRRSK